VQNAVPTEPRASAKTHAEEIMRMKRRAFTLGAGGLLLASQARPAAAETTLSFPTWQAEEAGFSQWWKELIAAYEGTHPGVKIAMQQVGLADFATHMTVRFASNTPPDIVELNNANFGSFASQGWLEPLDDRLRKDPLPEGWSTLQSLYQWDGKTIGVLLMGYGFMLLYNERLLADAGVALPRNFAEFVAAVPKLTAKDKGIYGLSSVTAEYPTIPNEMLSYILWQGADAFRGGNYTFTDPTVVAALETYRSLVGGNAPLGSLSTMMRSTFVSGRAAFMLDGPWGYAVLNTAPATVRPALKMVAAPFMPHSGGATNNLHIPAGISPERKELVWQFIKLAMQPQWQRRFFVLTSSPPGLPDGLTAQDLSAAPQLAEVAEAVKGAVSFIPLLKPVQENVSEFMQILMRTAVHVLTTKDPVTQICAQTQAELVRAIPLS
jgi:multiple sugar transport system substrate-binding protein